MENNEQNKESKENNSTQIFFKNKVPFEIFMNPELTTKDIYETLWRSRDFELSNFRQPSIFLSTFLILCFTGYGLLLLTTIIVNNNLIYFNILACILSVISCTLSILWIMIAKGSKACYEKYERGISAFEKNSKYANMQVTEIGGLNFNNIKGENKSDSFEPLDLSNCILNTKGGTFSPLKINIHIGILSLIFWVIAEILHFIYFIYQFNFDNKPSSLVLAILSILVILVQLVVVGRVLYINSK